MWAPIAPHLDSALTKVTACAPVTHLPPTPSHTILVIIWCAICLQTFERFLSGQNATIPSRKMNNVLVSSNVRYMFKFLAVSQKLLLLIFLHLVCSTQDSNKIHFVFEFYMSYVSYSWPVLFSKQVTWWINLVTYRISRLLGCCFASWWCHEVVSRFTLIPLNWILPPKVWIDSGSTVFAKGHHGGCPTLHVESPQRQIVSHCPT